MTVKEVFELRKQGRVEEAYQTIVPMYKVHHGHYTTICMFWCGADMAKLHLDRKEPQQAARIMASLQRLYPSLDDKDRSAHQALLNLAIELAKTEIDDFSFSQFMDWWGTDNLTDDDWKAGESNSHPLPARGQKIATLLFHEARRSDSDETKKKVLTFIETALQHLPRNRNLQRAKALLLAQTDDKQHAIEIYRRLARYGKEAYIFSELAELSDDKIEQIALTVKAVQLQRSEAFRQKDRLRLALLLADKRPQYARYELDQVIAQRQRAGQHNNRQINTLLRQLQNTTPATHTEQQEFYTKALKCLKW
ncbi:MAG: acetyltransferase [Paludibacteraceae bacterium]|nr:acetyltransferase [Paludibacteraceae bacterium]